VMDGQNGLCIHPHPRHLWTNTRTMKPKPLSEILSWNQADVDKADTNCITLTICWGDACSYHGSQHRCKSSNQIPLEKVDNSCKRQGELKITERVRLESFQNLMGSHDDPLSVK
jgi:hypothetical protein